MSIGFGLGGGLVMSNADGKKNFGFGLNGFANLMYNINYNVSVGVEWNTMSGFFGSVNSALGILINGIEIVEMNNFVAKGRYTIGKEGSSKKGSRFFVGLDLGMYGIKPQLRFNTDGGNLDFSLNRKYVFGFTPEVGVIFGVFYMSASYDLPSKYKYNDLETSYSAIMLNWGWNIGIINN